MLIGGGRLEHPNVRYHFQFVLERHFRLFFVERGRMRFDTYFMPNRAEPGPGHAVLYALWRGALELRDHGVRVGPRGAVLADEAFFEGSAEKPPARVIGTGESWVGLELRVERASLGPVAHGFADGTAFLVPTLADATFEAATAAQRALTERAGAVDATIALLQALAADGVLEGGVAEGVVREEPERLARVWEVVEDAFARLDTGVPLQELADQRGVSLRQLARDFEELVSTFTVAVDPFRPQRNELRLRLASVLLSVPELTVAEVAQLLGWGSTTALDRAFRDARLPAPGVIRRTADAER